MLLVLVSALRKVDRERESLMQRTLGSFAQSMAACSGLWPSPQCVGQESSCHANLRQQQPLVQFLPGNEERIFEIS